MSARARRVRDTVPVLHNCGPGPVAVYKTGAVGAAYTVALAPVLDALSLHRAARTTLRRRILDMKAALSECGLLRPFHGIVSVGVAAGSADDLYNPAALPWLPGATEEELQQWVLMAFAHVTPPMLLFVRAPELSYCTREQLLRLRWFGGEAQA